MGGNLSRTKFRGDPGSVGVADKQPSNAKSTPKRNEHRKEMQVQEPLFGRLGLKKCKPKCSLTQGNANLETLSVTRSPSGAPSGPQEEGHELREYPKQVSKPLAERMKLLTKLRALYRHSLKEDNQLYGKFEALKRNLCVLAECIETTEKNVEALDLDVDRFREQCKEAEVLEKQLNLLAVKCGELRRNKEAVIYEAECLSQKTDVTWKTMDDLKLKVGNVREQCKEAQAMGKQPKLLTVERDQLIKDEEALMYEVECISEEIEMAKKDIDCLKLKVENIREQCKEAETMEQQMELVTVEGDELRQIKEDVVYEAECLSEETDDTTKDLDGLKLPVQNIREQCKEAEALQKHVTEQGDQLGEKNKGTLVYEAKCLSKEVELEREHMDALNHRNDSNRLRTLQLQEAI